MNLRSILLVGAITITTTYINAEPKVLELPNFNSGKAVWMVRAGVSFNSMEGDWKDNQIDAWESISKLPLSSSFPTSTGFNASIGFNKSFGNRPLYWGMELEFGTRGYKANALWSKTSTSSFGDVISHTRKQNTTLSAYNVNLTPITIGYKYTFLSRMAVDVHASAFAGFDFAGQFKTYNYDYQLSAGKPRVKESTSKVNISDADKYRRFDAGLKLGVGYWFGRMNIDFTWQRGFVNLFDADESRQSQSFNLRLGYAF